MQISCEACLHFTRVVMEGSHGNLSHSSHHTLVLVPVTTMNL